MIWEISFRTSPCFKEFLDETFVYPIFILVLNYDYEMCKKGVLGFSISYLVLEILYRRHGDIVWKQASAICKTKSVYFFFIKQYLL